MSGVPQGFLHSLVPFCSSHSRLSRSPLLVDPTMRYVCSPLLAAGAARSLYIGERHCDHWTAGFGTTSRNNADRKPIDTVIRPKLPSDRLIKLRSTIRRRMDNLRAMKLFKRNSNVRFLADSLDQSVVNYTSVNPFTHFS